MDSAVIAAVISILGAGFLAMFGFFMRGLRNDVAALATEVRAEIAALRTEMRTEIAALRAEMHAEIAALRTEMHAEIADLRTEMRTEIADLRAEMRAEMAEMRADIKKLQQAVARIEGVIAEHSRQLSQMADHGERIAALEKAAQLATA